MDRKLNQLELLKRQLEFRQQELSASLFKIHNECQKISKNMELLSEYIKQYENNHSRQSSLPPAQFINHQAFVATLCQNLSREQEALDKTEAHRETTIQELQVLKKKIETIHEMRTGIEKKHQDTLNQKIQQDELELWLAHQYNQSNLKEPI